MKALKRLRFGVGFFLGLSLLLAACSEEPAYDLKFNGTPTELAAHITDFRENFEIKLSDVNRELEQLEATIRADSAGQEADSNNTLPETKLPDSSQTLIDSTQLDRLHIQLDRLSEDLSSLDAATDSVYLNKRDSLEKGLNEIMTRIEFIRLSSIESSPQFEMAADARLNELELEMMDVERRISRIDTLVQSEYLKTLMALRGRQHDLRETLDAIDSTSPETLKARRTKLIQGITRLGSDVRATTNEVLGLSSGYWNVLKPETPQI